MAASDDRTINILLTSFPGLGIPRTLALPVPFSISISDAVSRISQRLPDVHNRLILSTTDNRQLLSDSTAPLSSLLSNPDADTFIPLRLSAPLCGGKGGFGSQLRAAGGRMSSRKKKNGGDPNGSSRNLDGRRLRTITEAKNLAEYLVVKPEMDRKEKEERRKRWEEVVDMAERKQDELRAGGKKKLSEDWMDAKNEASEKTREAVLAAVRNGEIQDILRDSEESGSGSAQQSEDSDEEEQPSAEKQAQARSSTASRSFFGWDEDEESSDSSEDKPAEKQKQKQKQKQKS
jgi:hypothetical protein